MNWSVISMRNPNGVSSSQLMLQYLLALDLLGADSPDASSSPEAASLPPGERRPSLLETL